FAVPFFYLMGRDVKRRGWTLAVGGVWLLAMHFVDLYWQVMPTLHPDGVRPSPLDAAAFIAVGGGFVGAGGARPMASLSAGAWWQGPAGSCEDRRSSRCAPGGLPSLLHSKTRKA